MTSKALASVCLVIAAGLAYADGERGSLGFSVNVDGEGFFLNPTLKSVTIVSVTKGAPAANASIAAGDMITEAEGRVIAGSKGRELESLMKVSVGQSLHLKLKRPNGEEYSAVLVAVPRGPKP
ncbi:hypothetical protein BH11PSE12_BH11PSE12_21450 [soil metagenome]